MAEFMVSTDVLCPGDTPAEAVSWFLKSLSDLANDNCLWVTVRDMELDEPEKISLALGFKTALLNANNSPRYTAARTYEQLTLDVREF